MFKLRSICENMNKMADYKRVFSHGKSTGLVGHMTIKKWEGAAT